MLIQQAIAWTCVGVFAATAVITLLAITNVIALADKKYRDKLFRVLVVEIVVICVGFFAGLIKSPQKVESTLRARGRAEAVSILKSQIDQTRRLSRNITNMGSVPSGLDHASALERSVGRLSHLADSLSTTKAP